ncbi:Acetyltransferase YpeA [Frondihabitans sp. 762G35]|uniref:GNAT family N-acetyltransferase n=1 Tax=Frondihabitans sp. 762G35 TaxID=1446794 RepID=UPI000D21DE50|nr:acetyltransferase [Frondihabitans sp. 762G35]ARC58211.1 Acetyltransferase YpeA [Frondihabitans sp. 762G35]
MSEPIILPAQAPERQELQRQGWAVVARSFGAQLDADGADQQLLSELIARIADTGRIRELRTSDVEAVLALDAATAGDYPGSIATQHQPLDASRATPSPSRRAFGALTPDGDLVAMTFVDIDGTDAETDFTVVRREWRGRGLGTAVKAASLLALLSEGVGRFRTGGSADNEAILASNSALGYVRDEEWVTLERVAP